MRKLLLPVIGMICYLGIDIPFLSANNSSPIISNFSTLLSCGQDFFDNGGDQSNYNNESNNETVTLCPQVSGEVIAVTFLSFELENNGDNCYDELMIFNGDDVTHPAIASPNGTTKGWCWDNQVGSEGGSGNLEGLTLTSTDDSGCLTFVFNSDGLVNRSGWKASVACNMPPMCPAPSNLNVDNITHVSADLHWEIGGGSNQSMTKVEWGPVGFTIGNGESAMASGNSTTASNLWASTTYEFYVQDDCSSDGTSAWVGPFVFETSCAPFQGDSYNYPVIVNALPFSSTVNTDECYSNQIGNDAPDAFYSFTTSSCADFIVVSTCNETTDFDTYLILLDGSGNEIVTNDDSETACNYTLNGEERFSEIRYDVEPFQFYTVVLEGFGTKSGIATINISEISVVDTMMTVAQVMDVSCQGMTDGSIEASVTGGIQPLVATWSTGDEGFSAENLASGNYQITIQDGCGQIITETFEVNEPNILQISTSTSDETFAGENDGIAEINPSGGTAPYSYLWNTGETTSTIENLSVGQYCVTVTDAYGCTAEACDLVLAGPTSSNEINGLTKLQLQPNPASEIVLLDVEFLEQKNIQLEVYSSIGQLVYEMKNENVSSKKYTIDVSDFASGVYIVRLVADGQQATERLIVRH